MFWSHLRSDHDTRVDCRLTLVFWLEVSCHWRGVDDRDSAFSDALGIHVSEESENVHTRKEIWEATLATFSAKFLFALTFIVPVLIFDLSTAIIVATAWGMLILTLLSFSMAKINKEKAWTVIVEHVVIAVIVVLLAHYVGDLIAERFG